MKPANKGKSKGMPCIIIRARAHATIFSVLPDKCIVAQRGITNPAISGDTPFFFVCSRVTGITMIAAPGVPGGAIMASLGILQSMLGFDESAQALMIALYIAMDSFGTACNVTGDGAIALVVDKIYK